MVSAKSDNFFHFLCEEVELLFRTSNLASSQIPDFIGRYHSDFPFTGFYVYSPQLLFCNLTRCAKQQVLASVKLFIGKADSSGCFLLRKGASACVQYPAPCRRRGRCAVLKSIILGMKFFSSVSSVYPMEKAFP